MALYKLGFIHPKLVFKEVEILTTFCCLCHNFGSRYARKPIKCTEDSEDSLVFKKNLGKKLADWTGV